MNWASHTVFNLGLIAAMAMLLISCEKEGAGCLSSRGANTTERFDLDAFDYVHLNNRFDVVFIQDSVRFARVEFGEHVIEGVQLEVEDAVLNVREVNSCDFIRKSFPLPRVEIHYTQLRNIYSENAGTIRFEKPHSLDSLTLEVMDVAGEIEVDVTCEHLSLVMHTGATDISATGSVTDLYIYNNGYSPVHAEALVARYASVHNEGIADVYVRAWETLFYQIYRSGNIYLYGIADAVKYNDSGNGQVFFVEE